MFSNLPENIVIAIKQGIVSWKDLIREDFHVLIFREHDRLLFVPRYPTDGVIRDCFWDALQEGKRMIRDKECDRFNIEFSFEAEQTVLWPHVCLTPLHDAQRNQNEI